jgi:chromosome segregation ATPase
MKVTQANVGKMETQLQQWGAKLDELVAQAEEAGTEAKLDYRERIDALKAKHQLARSQLDELKATGNEKWETLKTGLEGAWNELEDAFKKLTN